MRKKVLILTEGGTNIGLGHITRCLALYDAFKEYGFEPFFLISGNHEVDDFLQRQKVKYRIENWLKKVELIRDSVLIIDSYLASRKVYSTLRKNNNIVVAIDDYNRVQYNAHIVISPTIYGKYIYYKKHPDNIYLLGPKYIILRKEFWNLQSKKINENIRSIMITFGGGDLRNLTPRVLDLLKDMSYILYVVIGRAFKDTSYISKYRKYPNIKFYFDLSSKEISHLMLLSDIAISSCGQITYELARIGVPTIGIVVTENQKLNAQYFQKLGFLMYVGEYIDSNLERNILEALEHLNDYSERKLRSEIGRKLVDGLGAKRIVSEVITYENRISGRQAI